MRYSWAKNLYDYEGDSYEDCILVFAGDNTILKFKTVEELERFAGDILGSIKEIKETHE